MQGLAKQSGHIMNTILSGESFSIVSFQDNPSGSKEGTSIKPHSVKRVSDGEIFTIGDMVTNGLWYEGRRMQGAITGFNLLEGQMFVSHTWSGIGMNLESLHKLIGLPSAHQIDDKVYLNLWGKEPIYAQVHAVHFYAGKVKYDLEVFGGNGENTRIYNVDSAFVISKKA